MIGETLPEGVEVFELSADASPEILLLYLNVLRTLAIHPKILIIRFNQIKKIDPTAVRVLNEFIRQTAGKGIHIIFSDVSFSLKNQLENNFLLSQIGEDNIFSTLKNALVKAEKLV